MAADTAPPAWATAADSDAVPNVASPARASDAAWPPAMHASVTSSRRPDGVRPQQAPPGRAATANTPDAGRRDGHAHSSTPPPDTSSLLAGLAALAAPKAPPDATPDGRPSVMHTLAATPPHGGGGAWDATASCNVAPGVDAPAAYAAGAAAGERAALLRLFREALPSQQALGALASAVRSLDDRTRVAEAAGRSSTAAASAALATAAAAERRVSALEAGPVADLQAAARDAAPARLSAELRATLDALTGAVAEARTPGGGVVRGARWAVGAAASLARGALDAADGAAVAVSRRVLLDGACLDGDGVPPAHPGDGRRAARARARAMLGGALFVAAVEAAWQVHRAAGPALPTPARRAARPLGSGLRTVRAVTWAAALTLGVVGLRRACFSAADAALAAAATPAASGAEGAEGEGRGGGEGEGKEGGGDADATAESALVVAASAPA